MNSFEPFQCFECGKGEGDLIGICEECKSQPPSYCVQCGATEPTNGVGYCTDCERGLDQHHADLLGLEGLANNRKK